MIDQNITDRNLLHKLNGQLLKSLRKRLESEIQWNPENWIANILVLHHQSAESEQVVLETSATLYKGTLFDSEKALSLEGGVGLLDRRVPLQQSFSGYCIRTGNIVWVNDLQGIRRGDPLYRSYRAWQCVAVRTETTPVAEYVFPIRQRIGLSETLLGVFNAECLERVVNGEDEFGVAGRLKICDIVIDCLDRHAPFLVLAANPIIMNLQPKETQALKTIHKKVLDHGRITA